MNRRGWLTRRGETTAKAVRGAVGRGRCGREREGGRETDTQYIRHIFDKMDLKLPQAEEEKNNNSNYIYGEGGGPQINTRTGYSYYSPGLPCQFDHGKHRDVGARSEERERRKSERKRINNANTKNGGAEESNRRR